jgi:hypothetical protein
MLTQLIWSGSVALETLLLVRAWKCGLLRRYPLFYGYISFVVVQEFARFLTKRMWSQDVYRYTYWITEYLGVLAGCLVVLEIYRLALSEYPGAARLVRNLLLFVFAMAFARGLASPADTHKWLEQATALNVERLVRTVQGIAILAVVSLFLAYSIPFGKNLRGILLGYSLFIAGRVICLTFVPEQGHNFWWYTYSASYIAVLSLWLAHLWSFYPVPQAQSRVHLERDYRVVAAATQRRFRETAGFLRRVRS